MTTTQKSDGQVHPLQERDPNTVAPPSSPGKESGKKSKSKKKSTSPKQNAAEKKATSPKEDSIAPSAADLSSIHLDGEEEESVPIYDTCDDVRKKINDHVAKSGVTQAGFCRELSELVPYDSVNPRQLARFLKFKGPRAGGHSAAFYAAYVYFEKVRIRDGKKKTKKREQLEETWEKDGGFPREGSHNMQLTCVAGETWRIDYLGQVQIKGEPRGGPIFRKKAAR